MPISKILVFSALSLLLSLPSLAQVTRAEGYVIGPDGKPVQGAVVAFDRLDQSFHTECTTDKTGLFGCFKPRDGDFRVTVTVDGQVRETRDLLHVGAGTAEMAATAPAALVFKLKPAGAAVAPAGRQKEAAKEPDTKGMSKEQADRYLAGKAALEANQYGAAADNLTKAAELGPKQAAVWSLLADVYMDMAHGQSAAEAAANRQKAWDAFAKAIEVAPTNADNYSHFALALAMNNRVDEARANMAKAIGINPAGAGKYHYNLGVILMSASQSDAAVEEFRKTIAADANYAEAYFYLGSTLAAKATLDGSGKMAPPDGTVDALQKYLSLRPDGPNAAAAKDLIVALGSKVGAISRNKKTK